MDTTGTTPVDTTDPGDTTQPRVCDPDTVYFEQDVLPIFLSNCAMSGCHNANTAQKGVRLTDYSSIINTGDVRAGRPDNSEVYEKMTDPDPDDRMPPPSSGVNLTQDQIDIIEKWILQGALNNSCDPNAGGCITTNMSFQNDIQPILQNNCLGCHGSVNPSGGVVLQGHAGVKTVADNGRLLGAIKHQPGFKPMPNGQPQLNSCLIVKIESWVQAGAPNN